MAIETKPISGQGDDQGVPPAAAVVHHEDGPVGKDAGGGSGAGIGEIGPPCRRPGQPVIHAELGVVSPRLGNGQVTQEPNPCAIGKPPALGGLAELMSVCRPGAAGLVRKLPSATGFTGEEIKVTDGVATITVPAPFGTRLFRVAITHP